MKYDELYDKAPSWGKELLDELKEYGKSLLVDSSDNFAEIFGKIYAYIRFKTCGVYKEE